MEFKIIVNILLFIGFQFGLIKVFQKAGKQWWEALIPGYNFYIWLKLIERPWWWLIILAIPGVNIMLLMVMVFLLVRNFEVENNVELVAAVFIPFVYLPYIGTNSKYHFHGNDYWKKYPKSTGREWLEALVFAVIAATIIRTFFFEAFVIPSSSMEKSLLVGDYLFVSKISYGAKTPITPLTVPFTHHTIPVLNVKSYSEWLQLPSWRLPGLGSVKNNDVVVFNYPDGDTVALEQQDISYYRLVRSNGRAAMKSQGSDPFKNPEQAYNIGRQIIDKNLTIASRPVDKRDNYVKRCVAIPGDLLEIVNQQVYINGKPLKNPDLMQFSFQVEAPSGISKKVLDKLDITDIRPSEAVNGAYDIHLNNYNLAKLKSSGMAGEVVPVISPKNQFYPDVFPYNPAYPWNVDNFGPLNIPKKGVTVTLDSNSIDLYDRIIRVYEDNDFKRLSKNEFEINGVKTNQYTFKQDYYFLMGDNRHNSADSRLWGFVPDDHVVGKAVFIWMSRSQNRSFPNIRFERVFSFVNSSGISKSYFWVIAIPLFLIIFGYNKRRWILEKLGR